MKTTKRPAKAHVPRASAADVLQLAAGSFRDLRTVRSVVDDDGGSSLARASVAKAARELGLMHLLPSSLRVEPPQAPPSHPPAPQGAAA